MPPPPTAAAAGAPTAPVERECVRVEGAGLSWTSLSSLAVEEAVADCADRRRGDGEAIGCSDWFGLVGDVGVDVAPELRSVVVVVVVVAVVAVGVGVVWVAVVLMATSPKKSGKSRRG